MSHANAGRVAQSRARLARIEAPFTRAQVFAVLGDMEQMFEMLERALTTSGSGLQTLISGPWFERYFQDARFLDFAMRAGLPMPIREARFSTRAPSTDSGAP